MNRPGTLSFRFNRFLERHLPRGLYRRSLLILMVPIVLIQLITGGLFLDRHWDQMTKILGRSLSSEIGLVTSLYEQSDKSDAAIKHIDELAAKELQLSFSVLRNQNLPAQGAIPFYALFDSKMQKYLARDTGKPFWVDSHAAGNKVEVRIEVEKGLIFRFLADEERAYAAGTPWILGLMLMSTVLLSMIAIAFLRKQVSPILDLARAAQAFGLGRDAAAYVPRGAAEVRIAGQSFIDMRRRIARHVDQRTTMLAGVSHDFRTILTRFKLQLALLGDIPQSRALKEDVDEMQHMLEDYLSFVRGDGNEKAVPVRVAETISAIVASFSRESPKISIREVPAIVVSLKPNSFRRLLSNILGNAVRYGGKVVVSGEVKSERLWIYVDDDGPGIPLDRRDDAFRPFVRLDGGRTLDKSGSGLGLAIALDIAQAHGGDINLEDSSLGGLRVEIKIPL
jgi:two-component system, OmpR family, osmolarity sensor histidine kinase EnvZ